MDYVEEIERGVAIRRLLEQSGLRPEQHAQFCLEFAIGALMVNEPDDDVVVRAIVRHVEKTLADARAKGFRNGLPSI